MLPRGASGGAHPVLPVSALVGGALAFVVGAAWLLAVPEALAGYVGAPTSVALTHVFTLLFVSLVYVGTLQQLPAVLLVTDLAWRRSGWVSVPLLIVGGITLVTGFAVGFAPAPMAVGGSLVVIALGIVASQVLATARSSRSRDPAARGLVTAVCYLFLTVALGLTLAAARSYAPVATAVGYPAALHQTTGLVGAFLLGITASGHKLLSMFALSKGGPLWRLRAAIAVTHLVILSSAVAAFAPMIGLGMTTARTADVVATVGICLVGALQFVELGALLRRRLRKRLEAPIERYVLAHAFLPLAGLLLALGMRPAAATAVLLGFVGLAVSGMLVKILSFLTWTSAFGTRRAVGTERAAAAPPPLLRDLVRPRLEPVITLGLCVGAVAATAAVASGSVALARLAGSALLVGAVAQLLQSATVVSRTLLRRVPGAVKVVTTE